MASHSAVSTGASRLGSSQGHEQGPAQEPLKSFVFFIALVILALLAYALLVWFSIDNWPERGQFGDMFGAANTLFSGLAFAALFFALNLQRKELSLQRLELSEPRAEFARQTQAHIEHANTALRAAKIQALGALLQSYTTLLQGGHANLIDPVSWPDELLQVKNQLKQLIQD